MPPISERSEESIDCILCIPPGSRSRLLMHTIGQPGAIHKRGKLAQTSRGAGNFTVIHYNNRRQKPYSSPNIYRVEIQVLYQSHQLVL